MDPWKTIPTLAGRHVRREPLQASHAADLVQAAREGFKLAGGLAP